MFLSFLVLDSSWVNCKAINRIITVAEDLPGAGLLAITSPDRLHRDWQAARGRGEIGVAERLLARLRPGAALVTVGDFHRATLSWLGAVASNTIVPLGIDRFGQSGDGLLPSVLDRAFVGDI